MAERTRVSATQRWDTVSDSARPDAVGPRGSISRAQARVRADLDLVGRSFNVVLLRWLTVLLAGAGLCAGMGSSVARCAPRFEFHFGGE